MRRVDAPGDNALGDEFQAIWDAIRSIRMGTQGIISTPHISFGTTPPSEPNVGDIWIVAPQRRWNGSAWVSVE